MFPSCCCSTQGWSLRRRRGRKGRRWRRVEWHSAEANGGGKSGQFRSSPSDSVEGGMCADLLRRCRLTADNNNNNSISRKKGEKKKQQLERTNCCLESQIRLLQQRENLRLERSPDTQCSLGTVVTQLLQGRSRCTTNKKDSEQVYGSRRRGLELMFHAPPPGPRPPRAGEKTTHSNIK